MRLTILLICPLFQECYQVVFEKRPLLWRANARGPGGLTLCRMRFAAPMSRRGLGEFGESAAFRVGGLEIPSVYPAFVLPL